MSILVIGAWIMGAVTLEEFGLALLVGLFVGAYSSIFIAAPIVVGLKEREPRNKAIRERLEAKRAGLAAPLAGAAAASDDGEPRGLDRCRAARQCRRPHRHHHGDPCRHAVLGKPPAAPAQEGQEALTVTVPVARPGGRT